MDDRCHSDVVCLAHTISVRDLRDDVKKQCLEETPIPLLEWIRLQFRPKFKHAATSIHFTRRLNGTKKTMEKRVL